MNKIAPTLTPMERAVLDLLAQGQSYKATAKALGIGHRTVEAHVQNVKRKIGRSLPLHGLVVWYVTTYWSSTAGKVDEPARA